MIVVALLIVVDSCYSALEQGFESPLDTVNNEDNLGNKDNLKNEDDLSNKEDLKNENVLKYQPSGTRGPGSPHVTPDHLKNPKWPLGGPPPKKTALRITKT